MLLPTALSERAPAEARDVARVVERTAARDAAPARAAAKPLSGITIALDPGHQLGNHNFPSRINRQVQAGGFTKPCNTTGTATNSGYPEATLNFAIATKVKARLEALGATVRMTRTRNSQSLWGPCVDQRGRFGAKVGADLMVSLHADGARAGGRGFHVIATKSRKPWTADIARPSLRLAKALRAGLDGARLPRSNYLAGGTALTIRSDLGTLNLSDVPVAMIEIGNMRNASDARRMKSVKGRSTYAAAVVSGIRRYLSR
ncbi:N-acetylmuramoyl-L-alanine amidase [Nocardioides marmoriginsengisoli]|uniref:N-acetylmuramoyl-L-alanine amidase n=1 Tax=Nocardioides marmoriginsengisoli TaxID=661483 RepID=A0A3N0CS27_9ACTN|nr:N-acetylmuramoyl-L-alanine amidase [Nocardioides marmoriginsengisoli]